MKLDVPTERRPIITFNDKRPFLRILRVQHNPDMRILNVRYKIAIRAGFVFKEFLFGDPEYLLVLSQYLLKQSDPFRSWFGL